MTRSERAAQIWPLLCFSASHRQTLTHEVLARLTGMAQQGLGQVLEPIQSIVSSTRSPLCPALLSARRPELRAKFHRSRECSVRAGGGVRVVMAGAFATDSRRTGNCGNAIACNGKSLEDLKREVTESAG